MKIYTLPLTTFNLNFKDTYNDLLNKELYEIIKSKKSEIDNVRSDWGSAKKLSNDYEYIYTSSNYKKNISSIIPVSRSFFKLREIIYDFHIDINGRNACIAEAPGGFIQSLLKHNEENNLSLKNIYGITLISDNKDIPFWNPSIIKNDKVIICNGYDNTGNLYKLKNVISFIKTCGKETCQLVTADGGFDYTSDFEQELSSYKLFYSEIMIAINIQKEGGILICKLFDLFYRSTLQLLFLLYLSYETISFTKPLTSRQSNSEKYIVCRGFKGFNKDISNIMCSNFGKSMVDIELPEEFIEMINNYHKEFINQQINKIDNTLKIISIRKNNDKPTYKQIDLAKEWCRNYKIPINKNCYYL
uniref:Ribosomal RNA methyltransferase FtsJ domain-containing protein n=1 Tax=viral metagenome TaxID=1070528 RepID=A0A6C0CEB5_9ZZZZ